MKQFIIAAALFLMANTASAAQIDSADYLGDFNINYPVVVTDNLTANAKINGAIRAEVQRFVEAMENQAKENNTPLEGISVEFKIPCNHTGGIVSVILTEYVNFEMAAHPSTFLRALNFNSATGELITVDSLKNITPQILTEKLKAHAAKNNLYLFDDLAALEKLPKDFYYDDDLNVHFLFQQYEVAPYAVGIIDLNAGK